MDRIAFEIDAASERIAAVSQLPPFIVGAAIAVLLVVVVGALVAIWILRKHRFRFSKAPATVVVELTPVIMWNAEEGDERSGRSAS